MVKNGKPTYYDAAFRCGQGDMVVDNFFSGGIVAHVNEEGVIDSDGHTDVMYGGPYKQHPDTHITFNGYALKGWKDALQLCCRAHSHMLDVNSIGWDVVDTPNGPLIIEAQISYSTEILQLTKGGWRKRFVEDFIEPYSKLVSSRSARLKCFFIKHFT